MKKIALTLALAAISAPALAGPAAQPQATWCIEDFDSARVSCMGIQEKMSLSDLYLRGWKVVALSADEVGRLFFIERQKNEVKK